jgi:hypothetical protein
MPRVAALRCPAAISRRRGGPQGRVERVHVSLVILAHQMPVGAFGFADRGVPI